MTIVIRKTKDHELDLIEEIYNESIDWLRAQGLYQWKRGVYPTRSSAQKALEERSLYSCLVDGRPAGTMILNEDQPPQYQTLQWKYAPSKILVLHTLVVRPSETGKGVARALVEYVLDHAVTNGYGSIRLDAYPPNKAAVGLYRSFGFEYVGDVFFEYKEPSYECYSCYEKLL